MFSETSVSLPCALSSGVFPPLEVFPSPLSGDGGIIRIVFPEFTCVCPKTGYPDFASIFLCYLPGESCLELKSWKLYLNSFRMVGAYHESVSSHLFETLKTLLAPRWLLLIADFTPRGNVTTTLLLETPAPRPAGADFFVNRYLSERSHKL